ncbi:MAG: OadG family protein [Kiritimatiellae bacterium]|nr:OadG family protein [Kiritimatiellia bacterium]
MLREAAIVMLLGMGTVFLVLVALLGVMTLGGRLSQRFCRDGADGGGAQGAGGHGDAARGASGAASREQHEDMVAVSIAAACRHGGRGGAA